MAMMIDENDVLEISGYLNTMNSRLMSLHRTSEQISKSINDSQAKVSQKKNEFLRLINDIKKDIAEMKEEIRNLQKSIIQIITVLKDSIKADEFSRFKQRIELWAPETFVSRKEVNDVLEKQ
jgi:seryl-tRNA synthetase